MKTFRQVFFGIFVCCLWMGGSPEGWAATQGGDARSLSQAVPTRTSIYHPDILRKIMKHVLSLEKEQKNALKKLKNVHSEEKFKEWLAQLKAGKKPRRKEYSYISTPVTQNLMAHLQAVVEHKETQFKLKGPGTIVMTGKGLQEQIGEQARFYEVMYGLSPLPVSKFRVVVKMPEKEVMQIVEEGFQTEGGLERAVDLWISGHKTKARIASIYGVS